MRLFDLNERGRVRQHVLDLAAADVRIVAGAVVGSLALGSGDRFSGLDLTFGVVDDVPIANVLADWTDALARELGAVHLFDLPSGQAIYRVFLLPGCLQCDLSFSRATAFAAGGPEFRMLFGKAVVKPYPSPPDANELFGVAVHHALRARVCIERGRVWQAEYWLSGLRDNTLDLACLHRDLPAWRGRGYDRLPASVLDVLVGALVGSLDREELLRALGCAIDGLLREAHDARALAARLEPQLRMLTDPWE